jgi:phosphatidylserine decarboxylase
MKMVKDAYLFIVPLLAVVAIAAYSGLTILAVFCLILVLFVAFFFRNPEREIPSDPDAIVSPADGRVIRIDKTEKGLTRISVFLSVFNVHVNRAPIGGRLVEQTYHEGRFHLAFDDRASVENEKLTLTIQNGRRISFSLIAGIVARRIIPWKKEGDAIEKGDRIALIRFGSRVDIELPDDCQLTVAKGDSVYGGSSTIARWK